MIVSAINIDMVQEFHRRMAVMISAVQTGIWDKGVRDLLGYATDYGLGRDRGVQTLVLKTSRRSAYLRLQWESVIGDTEDDRRRVDDAVRSAIAELA